MKAFLNRILLKKSIGDGNGNTFFFRYRVLSTPWFGVYLHRFVRGDMDRCLHNHPWDFLAVILRGGYIEEMFIFPDNPDWTIKGIRPTLAHWRRAGSILWRPAATSHRISLDPAKPKPWSLVVVGRKKVDWGFWTVNGWRQWAKGEPNPICEVK